MLPLLQAMADGQPYRIADLVDPLADQFGLEANERVQLLPSGKMPIFTNRLNWAKTYMSKAGLLQSTGRGVFRITDAGRAALAGKPDRIDVKFLDSYPPFQDFRKRSVRKARSNGVESLTSESQSAESPEDTMERAWILLRGQIATEVLDAVKDCSPAFFEQLVVDLLVAMGYGGSRADAGQVIGKPGDGGIDGVIKEDKLGLDAVYVQAKKWNGVVSRPDVQAFAGSLEGARARKGVFITTSTFSSDARRYVERIEKRIVLIDGEMLADLMIDYGVGVEVARSYAIPRVDLDYFEQE